MRTYKEFLGTCVISKKQYIYRLYQLGKKFQTKCFITFGFSTYQRRLSLKVHLHDLQKATANLKIR